MDLVVGPASPTSQAGAALLTDSAGILDWVLMIPGSAGGTSVWLQAAQYNQVTDVVATTIL